LFLRRQPQQFLQRQAALAFDQARDFHYKGRGVQLRHAEVAAHEELVVRREPTVERREVEGAAVGRLRRSDGRLLRKPQSERAERQRQRRYLCEKAAARDRRITGARLLDGLLHTAMPEMARRERPARL